MDGHQGMNAVNFVRDNLFDALASMLFENPEDIPVHVKEVFQQVDSVYCEERAKLLRQIIAPKRRVCFCGPKQRDVFHEVAARIFSSVELLHRLWLCSHASLHPQQPTHSCRSGRLRDRFLHRWSRTLLPDSPQPFRCPRKAAHHRVSAGGL